MENLLEEPGDISLTGNPGTKVRNTAPEEGYENLQDTRFYTETFEQMIIRKISQKIEDIHIDERIVKKIFSEKIEGMIAEVVKKTVEKERKKLPNYSVRRTDR